MAIWPHRFFPFSYSGAARARALRAFFAASVLLTGSLAGSFAARAQQAVGPATGLPVPRYVSLKSDHVNLREGPSKDHATKWIYQRAGLPVEITAEYETWRRIRDSEGAEGWVFHSLLSGKRTALVAPWKKDAPPFPLRAEPDANSNVIAKLEPGVIASVKKCDGTWCRLKINGYDGFMAQTNLWGVYPGEKVE
ncbi:MAG TPA: SH3 domain-containing protein [Rhodoblastus sp.]|nr:SH3 domain-containing protein [Rhodoblastus sp.]